MKGRAWNPTVVSDLYAILIDIRLDEFLIKGGREKGKGGHLPPLPPKVPLDTAKGS